MKTEESAERTHASCSLAWDVAGNIILYLEKSGITRSYFIEKACALYLDKLETVETPDKSAK